MAGESSELPWLAQELRDYLGTPSYEGLAFRVWADEEAGYIYIAPAEGVSTRDFHYVEDVVLFARYHGFSVSTEPFNTGAGLRLY